MRIAVLEDDAALAGLIRKYLEAAGHECVHYPTGQEFRQGMRRRLPDLAIVDRMLPDDDGIEATRWFRAEVSRSVPILFASARGAEEDIVRALDAGADDYLVKPLRHEELLARVRALGRRAGATVENVVAWAGITLDVANRLAMLEGERVELTDREFDLAVYLITNRERLVLRAELLEQVWHTSVTLETRTVDTHISRLRQKLKLTPDRGFVLEAIYNHGYRIHGGKDTDAS